MTAKTTLSSMAARSDMSLAKLKNSVNVSRFKSKYRHKSKFTSSNGHGVLGGLPIWANVLIFIAIVIIALFIAGLIYHFIKERRHSQSSGKAMRWRKILWGATTIAFFLWIPIYIYRAIKNRSWKGKGGSYTEIEEDQQRLNNAAFETKPWNPNQASTPYDPSGYESTMYNPYSAYAGASSPPAQASGLSPSPGEKSMHLGNPSISTSLHQPPPQHASGDLGSRTPSPPRASFNGPSQPPPTYTG